MDRRRAPPPLTAAQTPLHRGLPPLLPGKQSVILRMNPNAPVLGKAQSTAHLQPSRLSVLPLLQRPCRGPARGWTPPATEATLQEESWRQGLGPSPPGSPPSSRREGPAKLFLLHLEEPWRLPTATPSLALPCGSTGLDGSSQHPD